jgi:membrane protease YdiL (CAAX protease family)
MQNVAPNTIPSIDSSRTGWPLVMLVLRFGLFLAWQASIAGYFALQGEPNAWQASVAWWPVTVTLTNVICFVLLRWLARRDGITFGQLVHADFGREHLRQDLLLLLGVLLLAGPVAMIPNLGLAQLLYGDFQIAVDLFTQPLPVAVALITLFTFPLTQPLAEIPTYFGYAMPRLAKRWGSPWKAILVSAFWLGVQHMAVPFIPEWRFALWRAVMFIPFALLLAWAIHRRPRLTPYLMVVHALIDFPVALSVYQVSVG